MDIFSFLNSPDVAAHCRSIGHTFNAFECAVIINQCYTKTFEEKLAAYRAVINEYPDMEVPATHMHEEHTKSFHKALDLIIASEDISLKDFMESKPGAVYQVKLNHKNDQYDSYERQVFSTYDKAHEYLLNMKKQSEKSDVQYSDPKGEVTGMVIIKSLIDSGDTVFYAKLSILGEIINLDNYSKNMWNKNPTGLLDCYINIPAPFKKGDLVETEDYGGYMGNLFVLQTLSCDSEHHEKRLMYNDTSDMIAYVHYLNDGEVHCDHIHFYPNLRYCRRELKGDERIMKFVSLYIQEKICLCELLGIQKFLLADKLRESLISDAIKWDGNLDEESKKLLLNPSNNDPPGKANKL